MWFVPNDVSVAGKTPRYIVIDVMWNPVRVFRWKHEQTENKLSMKLSLPLTCIENWKAGTRHARQTRLTRLDDGNWFEQILFHWPSPMTMSRTDLLFVELTLVLLRDRREMMESPQFTTVPLLMLNVRNRYRSSLCRGLYGRSGSEQTRGRMWSGTGGSKTERQTD